MRKIVGYVVGGTLWLGLLVAPSVVLSVMEFYGNDYALLKFGSVVLGAIVLYLLSTSPVFKRFSRWVDGG